MGRVRKMIVEYFKNNVPQRQTAKALQISSSIVHDIIKRFRETGEISVHNVMSPGLALLPLTTRGRHLPFSWTNFP